MPYYQTISHHQAWQLLGSRYGYRVLDVREPDEFAAGHIPGAINIPLHTVARRTPMLIPNRRRPIIVCCGTGARSLPAVQVLAAIGYTNLYNLHGGIMRWPYALTT